MPIAPFRVSGLTDGSHRAPQGGCWLPATTSVSPTIRYFTGGDPAGSPFEIINRPALFYPAGYPLPVGTTQYAKMFSRTSDGRTIDYVPTEYTPRSILRIVQRIERARFEAETLGLSLGWTREAIDRYAIAAGPPASDVARVTGASALGLRPGEEYTGRQIIVLFNIGTSAAQRRAQTNELWDDIVSALDGSP
jgi:hypothetical protein